MKRHALRIFGLILVFSLAVNASFAQQRKASDAQKKKEKVERSYNKAYAKARKKTIKHRREIQTEETRDRMDVVDRKAKAYNRKNNEGFFERNFKRKKPPKR